MVRIFPVKYGMKNHTRHRKLVIINESQSNYIRRVLKDMILLMSIIVLPNDAVILDAVHF
jgi:hypothetical protein